MGEAELGAGNGVNLPLVGQLWYNTTNNQLYVYNSSNAWESTTGTVVYIGAAPTNPTLGALWYNAAIPQLEIYNGSAFVSVAALYLPLSGGTMTGAFSMGNNQIHNLLNPTAAQDAATKQYVDTVAGGSGAGIFVPIAGGTMTGTLTLNAGTILNNSGITLNSANIVMNTGSLTIISPPSGIAINANGRVANVTTSGLTDAVNATYGDTRWLNTATGGSVTGATTFTQPVTVPLTPTVSTQAASKGYVDSSLLGGFSENFYSTASYTTWTYSGGTFQGTGTIGYTKLPNGIIFQWGVTPPSTGITEGGTTVSLLVPMTILSVNCTLMVNTTNSSAQDQAGQCYFQPNVLSSTVTLFLQYMQNGNAAGGVHLSWFAVGH